MNCQHNILGIVYKFKLVASVEKVESFEAWVNVSSQWNLPPSDGAGALQAATAPASLLLSTSCISMACLAPDLFKVVASSLYHSRCLHMLK